MRFCLEIEKMTLEYEIRYERVAKTCETKMKLSLRHHREPGITKKENVNQRTATSEACKRASY